MEDSPFCLIPSHSWAKQKAENSKAAITDSQDNASKDGKVRGHGEDGEGPSYGTQVYKAQEQDKDNDSIPDSDSVGLFEPHVEDGVNDSKVTLHTGQAVKQGLSRRTDADTKITQHHHCRNTAVDGTEERKHPKNVDNLQDSHAVGEDISVAGLSCPWALTSSPTHTEDEDGQREAEDKVT